MNVSACLKVVFVGLFVSFVVSCAKKAETGPGDVRWDREVCVRCSMAIGDRNYSAQVRGIAGDGGTELFFFDDFGCAIHWLQKQEWKDDARVEVWVNNYQDGAWINGFNAWYVPGKITPMDYGLGATRRKEDNAIRYTAAMAYILSAEKQDANRMKGHERP